MKNDLHFWKGPIPFLRPTSFFLVILDAIETERSKIGGNASHFCYQRTGPLSPCMGKQRLKYQERAGGE